MFDDNYSRRDFNRDLDDGAWSGKRLAVKIFGLAIVVGLLLFALNFMFKPFQVVDKITDPDKIINNYEEFQSIHNTLKKLDSDLKTICETPDSDAMFSQFSKASMVAQKKQYMTRWAEEYNAKSKMITRSLWKSPSLPYQENVEDFANYNCLKNGR